MLTGLSIHNFVLIDDLSVTFDRGLSVLTGETGAGKTLLTQALELLMGERAGDGLVGGGGDDAVLQAVFELSQPEVELVPEEIRELAGVDAGELIATRRLSRTGRNRCFLNGTAVPLTHLGVALGRIIAFSGQHEHRRLLDPAYQLEVLDAFAGLQSQVAGFRAAYRETERAKRLLGEARARGASRGRERELLGFQVAELEAAALSQEEEDQLLLEQRRLAQAEELREAAHAAATALKCETAQEPDAEGALSRARTLVAGFQGIDPHLDEEIESLTDMCFRVPEAARGLRRFAEEIVVDPERLAVVEARLRLYTDLARKYGASTQAAIAFLERSRSALNELTEFEDDLERLERAYGKGREQCEAWAGRLSHARREAADRLAETMQAELADLDMNASRISVAVKGREVGETLSETGGDTVEFLLVSNPGLPPRSLARIASGGELSRTLLAVKCALRGMEGPETLVFDEVDAGIGGLTAFSVGRKLTQLARENQVIAITHLAQVAAFGDRHYLITKSADEERAVTHLAPLDEDESLKELSRMMGGRPGDEDALAHARAVRDRAASGLLD